MEAKEVAKGLSEASQQEMLLKEKQIVRGENFVEISLLCLVWYW